MAVDASALVAMITGEDDAVDLLRRVEAAEARVTSPVAVGMRALQWRGAWQSQSCKAV